MHIKVSVIVPIYNVEDYLEECLDSIEKQTLKDFEVLMIDDGSSDSSNSIARKYAEKNYNFKLIEQKNAGLSAARNTGLRNAVGDYIYLLDSDDFISHHALELLYDKACDENLDLIKFSAYTFIDGKKDLTWDHTGYKYKGLYDNVMDGIEAYNLFIDNDDYFPSSCLIFFKREILLKKGLEFCEGIINEDNLFHFQIITSSNRVAVFNEPLYYRRYRNGSITTKNDYCKQFTSMCISIQIIEEYIVKNNITDKKVIDWQVMFFLRKMVYSWEQLNTRTKLSKMSKEYLDLVKPIFYSHESGNTRYIKLLFYNRLLFLAFRIIEKCFFRRG